MKKNQTLAQRELIDHRSGLAGIETRIREKDSVVLFEDQFQNQLMQAVLNLNRLSIRQSRMAYDYSRPVEETAFIGPQSPITITPDYDQSWRCECILYSLPLGITAATLQFGTNRTIQLYSGAAIATQQPQTLPFLGIILGPDDRRTLTITGAPTTEGYIALMGHCLAREGDR